MSELLIMRYAYEDNEKGASKRMYGTNGIAYTSSSVPVQKKLVLIQLE